MMTFDEYRALQEEDSRLLDLLLTNAERCPRQRDKIRLRAGEVENRMTERAEWWHGRCPQCMADMSDTDECRQCGYREAELSPE